jgi:hypothetical protein
MVIAGVLREKRHAFSPDPPVHGGVFAELRQILVEPICVDTAAVELLSSGLSSPFQYHDFKTGRGEFISRGEAGGAGAHYDNIEFHRAPVLLDKYI